MSGLILPWWCSACGAEPSQVAMGRRRYLAVRQRRRRFLEGLPFLGWVLTGCADGERPWPPPPRSSEERLVIESARRAVEQFDGWTEVAFVVNRRGGLWRVEAWKIVHPEARGRNRCVPWASRGISVDDSGNVTAYENHP